MDDPNRPINSVNMVIKTDAYGTIEQVFTLPDDINARQIRFGFEGIAESGGKDLALKLEEKGYAWLEEEAATA